MGLSRAVAEGGGGGGGGHISVERGAPPQITHTASLQRHARHECGTRLLGLGRPYRTLPRPSDNAVCLSSNFLSPEGSMSLGPSKIGPEVPREVRPELGLIRLVRARTLAETAPTGLLDHRRTKLCRPCRWHRALPTSELREAEGGRVVGDPNRAPGPDRADPLGHSQGIHPQCRFCAVRPFESIDCPGAPKAALLRSLRHSLPAQCLRRERHILSHSVLHATPVRKLLVFRVDARGKQKKDDLRISCPGRSPALARFIAPVHRSASSRCEVHSLWGIQEGSRGIPAVTAGAPMPLARGQAQERLPKGTLISRWPSPSQLAASAFGHP